MKERRRLEVGGCERSGGDRNCVSFILTAFLSLISLFRRDTPSKRMIILTIGYASVKTRSVSEDGEVFITITITITATIITIIIGL